MSENKNYINLGIPYIHSIKIKGTLYYNKDYDSGYFEKQDIQNQEDQNG